MVQPTFHNHYIVVAVFQDLRKKYSGAVPLPTQEKFSKQMINLQNDKQKIEDELKQVNFLPETVINSKRLTTNQLITRVF